MTGFLAGVGRIPDPTTSPPPTHQFGSTQAQAEQRTNQRRFPPAHTPPLTGARPSLVDTAAAVAAEAADPDAILHLFGILDTFAGQWNGIPVQQAARQFVALVDAQPNRGAGLGDAVARASARLDDIEHVITGIADHDSRPALLRLAIRAGYPPPALTSVTPPLSPNPALERPQPRRPTKC